MKARAPVRRARVPNCTHVTMERVYLGADGHCAACGQVPSLGFLYECRQDWDYDFSSSNPEADEETVTESPKSSLRREFEMIGLSESIIVTAEEGKYTEEQLEKLRNLKMELNQAISDAAQVSQMNQAADKLAADAKGPPNHDGAFNSTLTEDVSTPRCCYRACHTCRPYFQQRIYISFGAVLANQFRPVNHFDTTTLPTKSAEIMRRICLSPPTSPATLQEVSPASIDMLTYNSTDNPSQDSSIITFKTTQSDVDDIDSTCRHRRRFYKLGYQSSGDIARDLSRLPLFTRHALKTAFQGVFRQTRESSSDGSNITLPMSRTGTARELGTEPSMGEFDMGALRRVRRQKERNDLRYGINGGFEGAGGESRQRTGSGEHEATETTDSSDSGFTVYSCVSEGSEVEVDGGVALTEEAVETHTPDILSTTAPALPTQRLVVGLEREEMHLNSLMTQV